MAIPASGRRIRWLSSSSPIGGQLRRHGGRARSPCLSLQRAQCRPVLLAARRSGCCSASAVRAFQGAATAPKGARSCSAPQLSRPIDAPRGVDHARTRQVDRQRRREGSRGSRLWRSLAGRRACSPGALHNVGGASTPESEPAAGRRAHHAVQRPGAGPLWLFAVAGLRPHFVLNHRGEPSPACCLPTLREAGCPMRSHGVQAIVSQLILACDPDVRAVSFGRSRRGRHVH